MARMRGSMAAALSAKPPSRRCRRCRHAASRRVAREQAVDGGAEVIGADFGRGEVAGRAAALAAEGGVEGDGEEAALGQRLGVEARDLLLDGAVGAADGDGRQTSFGPEGLVEVGRKGDAVAVVKGNFRVFDLVALREGLVPFTGQFQRLHIVCFYRFGYIRLTGGAGRSRREAHGGEQQPGVQTHLLLHWVVRFAGFNMGRRHRPFCRYKGNRFVAE